MNKMKKNLLIVGGSGSIGKSFLNKFSDEFNIFILDKKNLKKKNFKFNLIDIDLSKNLNNDFTKKLPDNLIVIYLVGNLKNRSLENTLIASINDNITSLTNFLFSFKDKIIRLIFFSSISVYGIPTYLPIDENHKINPFTDYGIQKACCETILQSYCKQFKIPLTIIRLTQVYGIKSAYSSLPHVLVTNFKKGFNTSIKTDLNIQRDYIHIDDLVNFIKYVLKSKKNGTFNFGFGKGIKILKLFKLTNNQNNKKPLQTSSKKFPNSFSQYFDISKELLTYGYQPTINIESWIKIKINRKKYEKKT